MVQPALPRFVHPGDRLTLDARAFNGTEAKGAVAMTAAFQGLTLDGAATQTTDAAAGGEAKFSFPVVVPEDAQGTAILRFTGKLGAHSDAIEIKLPIIDPGSTRKIVMSKLVQGSDSFSLPLPGDRRAGSVKVEIVASTSALSELKDAVGYVMEYPNGCIEQTTSTAYPLVVLEDLLPEMGVTVDPAELKKFSTAGVKRILSFQTTSGGLAYWPGSDQPHAFATAFGLTVLIEAKKRGYEVPDAALVRMADFLETSLRAGTITGEMPHLGMADGDTRAFFVMTLGRLGRPQSSYVSTLWDKRDQLSPFGLAFLGVAVEEGAGDKSLLQPILAAVKKASTEKPTEAYYDTDAKRGWSFDSPLRTHASALLAFAGAGDGGTSGKLLTGFLARRRGGMWGNTQENVFGMMAIARLVKTPGTDKPELTVKVNGKPLDAAKIHATTDHMKRIEVCAVSGLRPGPHCNHTRSIHVPEDHVPANQCNWHRDIAIDTRNGLRAGDHCPAQYVERRAQEVLPATYASWLRTTPGRARPPAEFSPLCPLRGKIQGTAVITYPRDGEIFLVEPGYDVRTQSLTLTAEVDPPGAPATWLIDGRELVRASPPYDATWPLAKGTHRLELVVGGKPSDPVAIVVR